ncbi:hypothetical protein N7535_008844 [Penicillium sp. DV-2018c]|nr:hypothetical protein N7461_002599 [Penicillium sp. DV-2018c]KAJ5563680.1 hypothetical protein N7535_008844 [Penicillium sp. DV-2018c]
MSHFTNGGRIVPILEGTDSHDDALENIQTLDTSFPSITPSLISASSILPSETMPRLSQDRHAKRVKPADHSSLEMPSLQERGLYALPTEGDGNCLYYSLSDQLYGNTHHADEIRQRLANHMAENKDYFMQFVVAEGGERRRPRRAAASAYATRSVNVSAPSHKDMELRFQEMIATSRKNGEWGSSEHLQAFCQVFKVDLNVYTMQGVSEFRDINAAPGESRNVLHVAYHDFKHYSSARVINGSHNGLLDKLKPFAETEKIRAEAFADSKFEVDHKQSILPEEKTVDLVKQGLTEATADLKSEVHHDQPLSERKAVDDTKESPFAVVIPGNHYDQQCKETTAPAAKAAGHTGNDGLAVDLYPPLDIKSIQEGLGGKYDRETIVDMLQKCRGDIDRAFAALLDDQTDVPVDKKAAPTIPVKPSLQASRSSSPFSTGSKRSAEDSDDSEDPRPARRTRPKRRLVSNLTLGVDISFRDELDEVVSLNLRMNSHSENGQDTDRPTGQPIDGQDTDQSSRGNPTPEPADVKESKCRRSGRLSRPRPI